MNDNDLISRASAIEWFFRPYSNEEYYSNLDVRRALNAIPTVDAAPVVHGRWIDIPDKPEWDQKACSVCGDYFCCQNNFCPNCGAKMDGE